MSDIPPSRLDYDLHYDDAGNAYARDHLGAWQPHPGIAQTVTASSQTSRPDRIAHQGLGGHASLTPATPHRTSSLHMQNGSRITAREPVIDPALLPLPESTDQDLVDPVSIAEAHGYTPVTKTAGARRKVQASKGKGKVKRPREITEDDNDARAKHGRPSGSNNYTSADVKALLNFVEDELPLGQRGWQVIHTKFAEWSKARGRPDRKLNSLETKFKQLVKTTKPTGDGVCPPDVTRAHYIDSLINERAGTCDLNDEDFDDQDAGSHTDSSSQDEPQHVAVARATRTDAPVPRCNARGAAASELLTRLSGAFDPAQQLRDSQATNENLRNQLFDLRARLYDVERARDKAELRVEMLDMKVSGRHRRLHSPLPKEKTMVSEWYPDGGQSIRWITDDEFEPYDDVPSGGPSRGYEARKHLLNDGRRRVGKAKEDISDDESTSVVHHEVSTEI
ncbi:hypothetical protein DEU56DRAFT_754155 [Suillus clintonianus]|uniref:uncharacterized protein n=1 Tax=Suillus clintonianus TaxID=1904413 RepID=UPI001B87388B|nr:uncharacterized protein DEU56DRAFT_754155 [Suillus clintonianus]KAG2144484.1 hypothetical protein DEU56DRAFT_754155 [Suillus clintonianus]